MVFIKNKEFNEIEAVIIIKLLFHTSPQFCFLFRPVLLLAANQAAEEEQYVRSTFMWMLNHLISLRVCRVGEAQWR